jgi:8-oxo-dGTP diphosphatase
VWTGDRWIDLPVPESGGEPVVVPNVAALVLGEPDLSTVLLQRRDKPGEVVRGRWEVPGGRWRAGESAAEAVRREVEEETGLTVGTISSPTETFEAAPHIGIDVSEPAVVVVGVDGAYPSLHVVIECTARGEPRALSDETAEPTWWPIDGLHEALNDRPDDFVWQSRAILEAWLRRRG